MRTMCGASPFLIKKFAFIAVSGKNEKTSGKSISAPGGRIGAPWGSKGYSIP